MFLDEKAAIAAVTGPWTLAAFAISALGGVIAAMPRCRPSARRWLFAIACLIAVVGMVPVVLGLSRKTEPYRIALQALDTDGQPLPASDLIVEPSVRGLEVDDKGSLIELTVNPAQIPKDGTIDIRIRDDAERLSGEKVLQLGQDHNPSEKIPLIALATHIVHGFVQAKGLRQPNVSVSISGTASETVTTNSHGEFWSGPHFSLGEPIIVHVEANGFTPFTEHNIVSSSAIGIDLPD